MPQPSALASFEFVLRSPRPPRWQELRRRGELLEHRPAEPPSIGAVETFECDGRMWILDADLGELGIDRSPPRIEAWPVPGIPVEEFERRVRVDWLPIIYTLWGRQAVHASAVRSSGTNRTIGFVGESGAGKSTLGYALGQRPGWRQLTDDATAFRSVGGDIQLLPIPSESRLRPPSAERFGREPWIGEDLAEDDLGVLSTLYFLEPSASVEEISISSVGSSRALQRLLEQAFAFTLKRRDLRQQMVEDYFDLCASVSSFRLRYPRDFEALEELLDAIESHCGWRSETRAL